MRNAQKLFDQCVAHLRKQGCKSSIPDSSEDSYICLYRSPEKHKCAIGCLIPDKDYKPEFEEKNLDKLIREQALPNALHQEFLPNRALLNALQHVHDFIPINQWEESWKNVAANFGLQYKEPKKKSKLFG